MKQEEFAEVVGYTQATVSRWESGEIDLSPRTADHIRLKLDAHRARNPIAV